MALAMASPPQTKLCSNTSASFQGSPTRDDCNMTVDEFSPDPTQNEDDANANQVQSLNCQPPTTQ